MKLIFVPLLFLIQRVWSAILDIPAYYLYGQNSDNFKELWINAVLVFLAVSSLLQCIIIILGCTASF